MHRNPIPIVLPCHRIVGANGSLTGYAGGLHVKRALLELEGATLAALLELAVTPELLGEHGGNRLAGSSLAGISPCSSSPGCPGSAARR